MPQMNLPNRGLRIEEAAFNKRRLTPMHKPLNYCLDNASASRRSISKLLVAYFKNERISLHL